MRAYYQAVAAHPLKFLPEAIKLLGPYLTQEYYLGVLTSLLGPNYSMFRVFSFIYKTFVALAIYFLVIKVTKDKLLAVAAFALYAISFTSTESIQFIIASTEYLVQLTFCIFLMIYHRLTSVNTRSIKWLVLFLLTFMLSIAFSPVRAFPILVIPLLIEFFILALTNKANLKDIFVRLAVLSPVYILIILVYYKIGYQEIRKFYSYYYFDFSEDARNSHFYSRSFVGSLVHWVTVLKQPNSKTCTRVIGDEYYEQLKQTVVTEGNNKVIRIMGNCFDPQTGTASSTDYVSFKPEYFYAYKIKDKSFIDIRSQLLFNLGL